MYSVFHGTMILGPGAKEGYTDPLYPLRWSEIGHLPGKAFTDDPPDPLDPSKWVIQYIGDMIAEDRQYREYCHEKGVSALDTPYNFTVAPDGLTLMSVRAVDGVDLRMEFLRPGEGWRVEEWAKVLNEFRK